ncbi:hypothetical protein CTI12_AA417040 [Artemisia annua]|uniref:Uncharacterized protein n=1 Tax=Artemisia annua TaxID=35608 RepID=A0A2U1M643_ARTAN|nr:hypothetical protein CTI12_AA417040 [Artemisia annua]
MGGVWISLYAGGKNSVELIQLKREARLKCVFYVNPDLWVYQSLLLGDSAAQPSACSSPSATMVGSVVRYAQSPLDEVILKPVDDEYSRVSILELLLLSRCSRD